jgi:hypothetical protein
MTEAWVVVLTPLLVLPLVLLFRFVGCGLELTGSAEPDIPLPPRDPPPTPPSPPLEPTPITTPPNYRGYILGEFPNPGLVKNPGAVPSGADVIAYWRLVDAAGSPTALDEKHFQDGTYQKGHVLPPITPSISTPGSTGRNPAHFIDGQDSLIDSDPVVKCHQFEGGHVRVNYKAGLYTDQFTIEAWIRAEAFDTDFEYVLFDAGGTYALPGGGSPAGRGFRVFVNRQKGWQVQLAPGNAPLFGSGGVPLGARTHVAVTVGENVIASGGVEKVVSLYIDGQPVPPSPVTVKLPPGYNRPDGAPLFIGVENEEQNPAQPVRLRRPMIARIQEVVLHRKALTREEIENHVDINRK